MAFALLPKNLTSQNVLYYENTTCPFLRRTVWTRLAGKGETTSWNSVMSYMGVLSKVTQNAESFADEKKSQC